MDVNTKNIKKNAFRVTKERGLTASRVRVPGGHLDAGYLSMICLLYTSDAADE